MHLERHAFSALAAGAVLALGAAGCASYDHAHGATYAGGAAAAAQEARGNRNAVMATIDDQVSRDIQQALHAASGLDARRIRVVAIRGHVTLEGSVPSEAEHQRAVEIARNTDVDRVVDVTDNLRTSG
jgi:osmotically-inducible protein OsmY